MQCWQNPSDAPLKCKWDKLHFIGHKKLMVSALCILQLFYSLSVWLHQVNKLHENMMRGKKKKNLIQLVRKSQWSVSISVSYIYRILNSSCKEMHNCLNGYHCQGYNPCCKSTQKNGFTCFIHFLSHLAQLIGASFSVENNLCVKKFASFPFTMLCHHGSKMGCKLICKCKFDIDLNGAGNGKVMALIPKWTHMPMNLLLRIKASAKRILKWKLVLLKW